MTLAETMTVFSSPPRTIADALAGDDGDVDAVVVVVVGGWKFKRT